MLPIANQRSRGILAVEGIRKSFGGLDVISDVSFDAYCGKTLGLIGPNGAGKTTLFNIIAGALHPNSGRVTLEGHDITRLKPYARCRRGIARTFQIPKPFSSMTVRENIDVALEFGRHDNRKQLQERALAWLERVHLDRWIDAPASALSLGSRKKLELVRALATNPSVILLDEVMGGLSPEEVDEVSAIVHTLRDEDIAVVFVEHVMRAIMNVADNVVVLHQGYIIASGSPQEVVQDAKVVEAYLGTATAKDAGNDAAQS